MAGPAAIAAGEIAMKILKNKWFWIGLATLIVLLIIRANWQYLKAKFARSFGDFTGEKISDSRQAVLNGFADNLHQSIHTSVAWGDTVDALNNISGVNDDELRYIARYYKRALSRGTSLYTDLNNEWMPLTDIDEQILTRLSKIGELA